MADLKSKTKEYGNRAERTLRDLLMIPPAVNRMRKLPEILDSVSKGKPVDPGLTGPLEGMTWRDVQAAISQQIDNARGYYRGYVQPRIQRTLRDLFY